MQDFDPLVGMVNTIISHNDRCSLLLNGNLPSHTITISTYSGNVTSIPLYSNSSGTVLAGQGFSFGNHLSPTTVLLKITGAGLTSHVSNLPMPPTLPSSLSVQPKLTFNPLVCSRDMGVKPYKRILLTPFVCS